MISEKDNFSGRTILHIGAGLPCPDVEIYLSGGAKRVVLLDADPLVTQELSKIYQKFANVEIYTKAVSNHSNGGKLYRLNLKRLRGIRMPTNLYDLFPGLELAESIDVDTYDISDLISSLTSPEENVTLVIEAPGEEYNILNSLVDARKIHLFSDMFIRCSREILYDGAVASDDVLKLLENNAFECTNAGIEDPDFLAIQARLSIFDYKKLFFIPQLNALKSENETIAKNLELKTTEVIRKVKLVKRHKSLLEKQQITLETTIAALNNESEAIISKLNSQMSEMDIEKKADEKKFQKDMEEKNSQLEELSGEIRSLKSSVAERGATIKWLRKTHGEKLRELKEGLAENENPTPKQVQKIVIASVPRSGGTWLFNAVRLILTNAGHSVIGAWYDDYVPDPKVPYHIIKVHTADQIISDPWKVFTTYRALEQRLNSLIRMGWIEDDDESILNAAMGQAVLYDFWNANTDMEYDFSEILENPTKVIGNLAGTLGVSLPNDALKTIASELEDLRAPKHGKPDPVTLMHPGHREASSEKSERSLTRIQTLLDDKFFEKD